MERILFSSVVMVLAFHPGVPDSESVQILYFRHAFIHLYLVTDFVCKIIECTEFQVYRGGKSTYPCFHGVLLTSTLHNILCKPLAVFPHNHCWKNRQLWERNESCCNDYHQSLERILAEPEIEALASCSQVLYATNPAMGLRPYFLNTWILQIQIVSSNVTAPSKGIRHFWQSRKYTISTCLPY